MAEYRTAAQPSPGLGRDFVNECECFVAVVAAIRSALSRSQWSSQSPALSASQAAGRGPPFIRARSRRVTMTSRATACEEAYLERRFGDAYLAPMPRSRSRSAGADRRCWRAVALIRLPWMSRYFKHSPHYDGLAVVGAL